jgi:hypothetical protein
VEEFFNKVILIPGYCFEARMWGARMDFKAGRVVKSKKEHAVAGWFSKGAELAFELTRVMGNVSVYLCPNPLRIEDRPKQAKDRFSYLKAGQYACDEKIAFVRWLIFDIDPVPPDGESRKDQNSTDRQFKACIDVCNGIVHDKNLNSSWACQKSMYYGSSGNGCWAILRVPDLEIDKHKEYIDWLYSYIESRYSNEYVKIDTQTRNPSRSIGIPGTLKCKAPLPENGHPYRFCNAIFASSGKVDDDVTNYAADC